ncbi:MAG: DUF3332 family protein [Leptospiraceae bacterium]|nr:DUF3332 family protein [Leptospiraceae bacterium]
MTKSFIRKVALVTLLVGGFFLAFGNCFGKFALIRKFYAAHDGINVGSGMLARFVKTILLWFPFGILYAISAFFDLILFNLIEFWTGNNVVGLNEYSKDGVFVKNFENGDEKLKLTYSGFGARVSIDVKKGNYAESFVALRSEPGKLYKESNGSLSEIEVSSQTVGSKMILKMAQGGKLQSTKIVDVKDYQTIEKRFASEVQ